MHTHIQARKIFWFWLYTPFVQLGFIRFCVFDLSLMSFRIKPNLHRMNNGMWMDFASCVTPQKLVSPKIPICILCVLSERQCWTGLDWTCVLFSHCDSHDSNFVLIWRNTNEVKSNSSEVKLTKCYCPLTHNWNTDWNKDWSIKLQESHSWW